MKNILMVCFYVSWIFVLFPYLNKVWDIKAINIMPCLVCLWSEPNVSNMSGAYVFISVKGWLCVKPVMSRHHAVLIVIYWIYIASQVGHNLQNEKTTTWKWMVMKRFPIVNDENSALWKHYIQSENAWCKVSSPSFILCYLWYTGYTLTLRFLRQSPGNQSKSFLNIYLWAYLNEANFTIPRFWKMTGIWWLLSWKRKHNVVLDIYLFVNVIVRSNYLQMICSGFIYWYQIPSWWIFETDWIIYDEGLTESYVYSLEAMYLTLVLTC